MKKLIIIVFLLSLCYSCKKEKLINEEQYSSIKILSHSKINNLKGKVIEYSEAQYLNPYETDSAKGNKTIFRLDSIGNLLEQVHSGIFTKISRKQNIEITTIQNENREQISWAKTIITVKSKSILLKSFGKYGGSPGIIKYSLDDKGYIIKKETFGTFSGNEKETYVNDKDGKCIEEYTFDIHYNKNLPFFKTEYKYDIYGNIISETHYPLRKDYPSQLSDYTYKYTYDDKGNWLTQYFYEDGKLLWRNDRRYIYK